MAAFWDAYAQAEVSHAQTLRSLRDRLSTEQLSEEVETGMMDAAYRALQSGQEKLDVSVTDLEAAYELASELENGETNAVFEFLITNFAGDKKAQAFLRSQLKDHIAKLMLQFPAQFGNGARRREIKASSF